MPISERTVEADTDPGDDSGDATVPLRSPSKPRFTSYTCLVDLWSYDRREVAEIHVRLQHGATNYGAFLAKKKGRTG